MLLDTVITRVLVRSFLNLAAAIKKLQVGVPLSEGEQTLVTEFVDSIEGSMTTPPVLQQAANEPGVNPFEAMFGPVDVTGSDTNDPQG
jgi:hypothetical protein